MHYDPMIAKLVTHAATREAAIDLQADALDAFVIDGVEHNIPFLAALMQHPRWREGRLSTGFIAEEYKGGFKPRVPQGEELRHAGGGGHRHRPSRQRAPAPDHRADGRAGRALRRPARRQIGEARAWPRRSKARSAGPVKVDVRSTAKGKRRAALERGCRTGGPASRCGPARCTAGPSSVQVRPILNGYDLAYRGVRARAHVYTEREAELAALMPEKVAPDTSKLLLCPMPGLVKAIHVAVGQEVKTGEALCVVEAMKMENILRAEREAVVKAVKAKPGDSLAVDAVIMEFA